MVGVVVAANRIERTIGFLFVCAIATILILVIALFAGLDECRRHEKNNRVMFIECTRDLVKCNAKLYGQNNDSL